MHKSDTPRRPMKSMSDKQRAKLVAEGNLHPSSTVRRSTKGIQKSLKPIATVGKQKAKRQARNKAYYASAEWRAKRKAVFERDGFQCVETLTVQQMLHFQGEDLPMGAPIERRCPNHGEVVNGKQTARGLVCEESSYGHRGKPERIDTCKTRCQDCDRRLTPMERINHAHGFNNQRGRSS